LVSIRQSTFSLKKCIEKYGDVEGLKIFKARQEKWLTSYYDKSKDEMFKIIKSKESYKSTAEMKLIESCDCEHSFMISSGDEHYVYDMRKGNNIVEYNGTYWHCEPRIYDPYYFNKRRDKFACEIWDYDDKKIKYAEDHGYNVLVIWEEDYINNREEIIQKCNEFLNL